MNKIDYYKDLEDLVGLANIKIKVSNWAENFPTIKKISLYRNKHQAKEYVIVAETYDSRDIEVIVKSFDKLEDFSEYFNGMWYLEFFHHAKENEIYDKNDRKWSPINKEVYDPNDPQWFVKFKKDFLSFAEKKFLNDLPILFKQELERDLFKTCKTKLINLYPSWSFYSKTPEQEFPKTIFKDSLELIYERQDGPISGFSGKVGHNDKNTNETETADTPDRSFINMGDHWQVNFNGEKTTLKNLERLRYIIHLLDNPGKEISSYRLTSLVKGNEPQPNQNFDNLSEEQLQNEGLTQDEILIDENSEDFKSTKEMVLKLWNRLITSPEDEQARLNWKNGKDTVQETYGIIINDSGEKPVFIKKEKLKKDAEKARSNVSKQISSAIKDIDKNLPLLAKHLDKEIKKGAICTYPNNEDNLINWNIKW